MPTIDTLYHDIGDAPLRAMVAAFYRQIRSDDLIGPMYPADDWEGSEKRLADFIIYRLGGPQTYIEERGHPRLRGRHVPFSIGIPERDRWMALMRSAMVQAAIPVESVAVLDAFFAQLADFMRNRPE